MHADHITGSGYLKALSGCKSIISKMSGASADIHVLENDFIEFGKYKFKVFVTPGHTNGCCSFYCEKEVSILNFLGPFAIMFISSPQTIELRPQHDFKHQVIIFGD